MITTPSNRTQKRWDPFILLVLAFVVGLTVMLAIIIWTEPTKIPGLEEQVARHLAHSGATSPVTAVLLNFRGYDTLLEVMVLFLAVLGVWSLTEAPSPGGSIETSPVQTTVVRLLAPLMCLVAAYLVWQGSHLAGGAFQGGAVLAGAGVLITVADVRLSEKVPAQFLRVGLVLGPSVFLTIALGCLVNGGTLLAYPKQMAGSLLLIIETACAISIGLTLTALFVGGRPKHDLPVLKRGAKGHRGKTTKTQC